MRDEKERNLIKLQEAGATVQHTSPFEHLKPFRNDFELTQDFLKTWVIPFYINIGRTDQEWVEELISVKHAITTEIIQLNLGDFNWRTRQTGAFFSAITNQAAFIDIIGTHLLRSEVSFAGSVYCEVLALFNMPKCVDYLQLYLDYYLSKPDLGFDQRAAMEAILYLDKLNSTNHYERHIRNWMAYIKDKPNWSSEISTDRLERKLNVIHAVRQYTC